MKKLISILMLSTCTIYSNASNNNKPIAAQYGFIENKGQILDQNNQINKKVLYLYNGFGLHVQLKQSGFSYEVIKTESKPKVKTGTEAEIHSKFEDPDDVTYFIHRIDISFVGANQNAKITAFEPSADYLNYYTTGTSEEGVINVHHYKNILYRNIYPNIDVEFILNDLKQCGGFKYNIIVHPGGNPDEIKMKFAGANKTSLTSEGNILIETAYGNIEEQIPLSYQLSTNDKKQIVQARFSNLQLPNTFGIDIKNFDSTQTLVIDPAPWATYIGGTGGENGRSIASDLIGNVFMTGYTGSATSIASSGAWQTTYGDNEDILITKFNSIGTRQWATYYGGFGGDYGFGIITDAIGNVLVTGNTTSLTSIASSGAWQISRDAGSADAFIAKFTTGGTRIWGTYYGGNGTDNGKGIVIDLSGNILITGFTVSTSAMASSGALQTVFGGGTNGDAFIAKFNSSGSRIWGTYYGGSGSDIGYGIATDAFGNAIIGGETTSTSLISTTGAFQTVYGGGAKDAFILRLDSNGSRRWATYFGGSGDDFGYGIASDQSGSILLTGYTTSISAIASSGAWQTTFGGGNYDAFIVKLDSVGLRQWSTYYGGSGAETGAGGIATDLSGNIFVTGRTMSSTAIATTNVFQPTYGGSNDAFIAKFSTGGSRVWATYFGGIATDYGYAIATGTNGNVLVAGETNSSSGIARPGAFQTTFGGGVDAFVVSFTSTGALPVKLISFNAKLQGDNQVLLNWQTASETNNKGFEIERSIDEEIFENINFVKENGTKTTTSNYQFTDNLSGIQQLESNQVYYRLKQIDFDGQFEYSKTVRVKLDILEAEINVYPNPSSGIFTFENKSSEKCDIQMFDVNGRLVDKFTISAYSAQVLDYNYLGNGLFLLCVIDENGMVSNRKIVIGK